MEVTPQGKTKPKQPKKSNQIGFYDLKLGSGGLPVSREKPKT